MLAEGRRALIEYGLASGLPRRFMSLQDIHSSDSSESPAKLFLTTHQRPVTSRCPITPADHYCGLCKTARIYVVFARAPN